MACKGKFDLKLGQSFHNIPAGTIAENRPVITDLGVNCCGFLCRVHIFHPKIELVLDIHQVGIVDSDGGVSGGWFHL